MCVRTIIYTRAQLNPWMSGFSRVTAYYDVALFGMLFHDCLLDVCTQNASATCGHAHRQDPSWRGVHPRPGQTPEKRKRLFKWDPKELGPIPSWDNEWRQAATELTKPLAAELTKPLATELTLGTTRGDRSQTRVWSER